MTLFSLAIACQVAALLLLASKRHLWVTGIGLVGVVAQIAAALAEAAE